MKKFFRNHLGVDFTFEATFTVKTVTYVNNGVLIKDDVHFNFMRYVSGK